MITLKTLPQATAQEVFDQVARHLLTQMEQAMVRDPDGIAISCAYRTTSGLKCAAGCLMADDEVSIEDGWNTNTSWDALIENGIAPNVHGDLIIELQSVHDGCEPYAWPVELETVARTFDLNTDVLAEF